VIHSAKVASYFHMSAEFGIATANASARWWKGSLPCISKSTERAALIEGTGDGIIAFTALAFGAGEIMAAVQITMTACLPYMALPNAVLTHSTIAEGLGDLFSAVPRG
jgi:hypothetical protein